MEVEVKGVQVADVYLNYQILDPPPVASLDKRRRSMDLISFGRDVKREIMGVKMGLGENFLQHSKSKQIVLKRLMAMNFPYKRAVGLIQLFDVDNLDDALHYLTTDEFGRFNHPVIEDDEIQSRCLLCGGDTHKPHNNAIKLLKHLELPTYSRAASAPGSQSQRRGLISPAPSGTGAASPMPHLVADPERASCLICYEASSSLVEFNQPKA